MKVMKICAGCNKLKRHHGKGYCPTCYNQRRGREYQCQDCGTPVYRSSKRCNKCAHEARLMARKEGLMEPIARAEMPIKFPSKKGFRKGDKVKEKSGAHGDGYVIHGVVSSSMQEKLDGEMYVDVVMAVTGITMPLRVSTLERVFTPVEEWTDPATNVEDDVAAIFAEVGA